MRLCEGYFSRCVAKMKNTNKRDGNNFEEFFCNLLFSNGFWAHDLAQNQTGQPADVIAARNGKAYLIDCKVCGKNGFPFSHMEANQDSSMELWRNCGNGVGWFAFKLDDNSVWLIPHIALLGYEKVKSGLSVSEIRLYGQPFEEWVSKCK